MGDTWITDVSSALVVAIHDNRLLSATGVYGDPDVGDPVQIDELTIHHDKLITSIRVFNRAIMLFHSDDEIYRRVHRVCEIIERE